MFVGKQPNCDRDEAKSLKCNWPPPDGQTSRRKAYFFGRKATIRVGSVSSHGPPIKSTQ
jgi:hypothetical protein